MKAGHNQGLESHQSWQQQASARLEEYAEELYEDDMDRKVHSARCILRFCSDPRNLELVADHDTLLGVFSRELRENSKKSASLAVAIVSIFVCFSHYSQFHPVLQSHQTGSVIMRVLEYESERHQVRLQDVSERAQRLQGLGDEVTGEDRKLQAKDEKKYRLQLSRQNKLMHVCLMALLDMAEDLVVEQKLVNRNISLLLTQVLDREHEDLLLVTLDFMKKLSIIDENKLVLSSPAVLSRLRDLATHGNVRISLLSLRVLFNFSFDAALRSLSLELGIIQVLIDLLRNPPLRHVVLKLLYQFSADDGCKAIFAEHPEGMMMLLQLVVHFPEPRLGKELVALVVNLSTHEQAADSMVASGLLPQVMQRLLKTHDALLCKVLRHITSFPDVLEHLDSVGMPKWMHKLVRSAAGSVDKPDLLAELLGTLANITLPDAPWGELCEAGLIDLLTRLLVPGFSEDDIVLECVQLTSNLASSEESIQHVCNSRLPFLLQQLLIEKREDEDIVVQLLFAFQCLLIFDEAGDAHLPQSELAPCLMGFLARSGSPAIVEQATKALQLFSERGGDGAQVWAEQVKIFRFEQHNQAGCGSGDEDEFSRYNLGGTHDMVSCDWSSKDLADGLLEAKSVAACWRPAP